MRRSTPGSCLTERATRGGDHSGEVSFPGGRSRARRRRPGGHRAARSRRGGRAGRPAPGVRVVGQLERCWIPVSNFEVTPILAIAARRPRLAPSPAEVARILQPSVAALPARRSVRDRRADGRRLADPLRRVSGRRAVRLGRHGPDPQPARAPCWRLRVSALPDATGALELGRTARQVGARGLAGPRSGARWARDRASPARRLRVGRRRDLPATSPARPGTAAPSSRARRTRRRRRASRSARSRPSGSRPAGQQAASPAAIRVRSSPTPTQPPPSITMK